MWSHIGSGSTVPERSSQEKPELKIPVRNGRIVTKLRSQFGFYLNLKKFVRNGPRWAVRKRFLIKMGAKTPGNGIARRCGEIRGLRHARRPLLRPGGRAGRVAVGLACWLGGSLGS